MPLELKKLIDDIGDRVDTSRYCPDHWHDVVIKNERVQVDLTPGCGGKKRLIYVFRNKEDGKLLIGQTDTTARKRLYSYNWSFNTDRSEGKKMFPAAVRKNPEKFEWAVLKELKSDESLDGWEKAFIVALNTIEHGYNQNLGGGGGTSVPKKEDKKSEPENKAPDSPVKKAEELLENSRMYDFYRDKEGFYHADWSPTAKKIGSKIYGILLENDYIYIGKTDQELRKRSYQHFANARSETEKKDLPLYAKMAKADKGKVLLLDKDVNSPERKEGKAAKSFEDAGYTLLNVAGTGGGGASKARKVLFPPSPKKAKPSTD